VNAPERRAVERQSWKEQHNVLMGQMEEIAGKGRFCFYHIDLPMPNLKDVLDQIPVA
jgi:hypothetical protein